MIINGRHTYFGSNNPNFMVSLIGQSIKIDDANNLDFWLEIDLSQELSGMYLFEYWGVTSIGVPLKPENKKKLIIIADNEISAQTKGVNEAKSTLDIIHYECRKIDLFDIIECIKNKVSIL